MLLDCSSLFCDLLFCPLNNPPLQILDADNGKRLESSTGRIATRDIVQFVPMREVQGQKQSTPLHSLLLPSTSSSCDVTATEYYRCWCNFIANDLCPHAQVARSPSCNLFWRSCPASSCSTCAPGGSSRSSRLPLLQGTLQHLSTLHSSDPPCSAHEAGSFNWRSVDSADSPC